MPIQVELAGWKKVYKDGLPSYWQKRIEAGLTFPNPVYESMKKYRPNVLRALERKGEAPFPFLRFFRQTEAYYLVPRTFNLGDDVVVLSDQRVKVEAEYPAPLHGLWDIQKDSLNAWKEARATDGVVVIPTGSGKTILGLEIARRLKQKTLILTNRDKTGLANWTKDCKKYLGFKPGIIQGSNVNYEPPVTIGMFQTINARRDLMAALKKEFGLVIVDECQHVPAHTFVLVANNFHARYRYGVTATEKRQDGLEAITFATLGDLIFERRQAVEIVPAGVRMVRTGILMPTVINPNTEDTEILHSGDYSKSLKWLITNGTRNELLARKAVELGRGHYNLCVSHRVWHVKLMANHIASLVGAPNVAVLAAGIKTNQKGMEPVKLDDGIDHDPATVIENARMGKYKFVVGTYQYVAEGLDVPCWDALHMFTPTKNPTEIVQVIGRIRRKSPETNKIKAHVFDYLDSNGMWMGFYYARRRSYKSLEQYASNQGELSL